MTGRERLTASANTDLNQFRTPNKAAIPERSVSSGASKTNRRKSGSPFSTSSKSSKKSSVSTARCQPTLTQIDFVTRTQELLDSDDDDDNDDDNDDDGLDYIEEDRGGGHNDNNNNNNNNNARVEEKEVISVDDDSQDLDYRLLPHSTTRRVRNVRFEPGDVDDDLDDPTPPKRRRVSTPRKEISSEVKAGKKKTGAGAGKASASTKVNKRTKGKSEKKEKTLTQMDFVRRYLKIKTDDDLALEYIYTPKKDNGPKSQDERKDKSKDDDNPTESKAKRLEEDGSKSATAAMPDILRSSQETTGTSLEINVKENSSQNPVTPQKPRKFEIPSSQSPESPGFAVISSSQFRSAAARSPLKYLSPNVGKSYVREESPVPGPEKEESQNPGTASLPAEDLMSGSSMLLKSPALHRSEPDEMETPKGPSERSRSGPDLAMSKKNSDGAIGAEHRSEKLGRTVVYETDGETDYGDFDDTLETKDGSLNEDSQDLPPPAMPSEADMHSHVPYSEVPPSSDASICYQRLQPATQFPLEPIPTLNTQKLAELFPPESYTQPPPTAPSPIQSSSAKHHIPLQTQTQMQIPTQSPDLDHLTPEIVPESSPVMQRAEIVDETEHDSVPLPRDPRHSVVQVESSQPADKKRTGLDQELESGPRGFFTRSQLLTSSVMESIPMPVFWMGSQDSVGEPYSTPDG